MELPPPRATLPEGAGDRLRQGLSCLDSEARPSLPGGLPPVPRSHFPQTLGSKVKAHLLAWWGLGVVRLKSDNPSPWGTQNADS